MINLSDYYVTQIKTSTAEYILGHKGRITDEGSFYRIDDSFIIDKYRIKTIILNQTMIIIGLDNEEIMLTVTYFKEN